MQRTVHVQILIDNEPADKKQDDATRDRYRNFLIVAPNLIERIA